MDQTFLIITSIASPTHPVLRQFAVEAKAHTVPFIMVGDTKSPKDFHLDGCDFHSIERQRASSFALAALLPEKHYARKNLGYLEAMKLGAKIIIETDDDNSPLPAFWADRNREARAHVLNDRGWVNIYRYFSEENIWPRGFPLERILDAQPSLGETRTSLCPIQQGLADDNPDVDAVYRLTLPLPRSFKSHESVAFGSGTWCPFNSQNTTWFMEAFPLLYLPSYCSFRMTDIWRSFVAQRIAWTCGWSILFHNATVRQDRNEHDLLIDFKDEIPGYLNNAGLCDALQKLDLQPGIEFMYENFLRCYGVFIERGLIDSREQPLLDNWVADCRKYLKF